MKIKKFYLYRLYANLFKNLKDILKENRLVILVVIAVFILGFTLTYTIPSSSKTIIIEGLVEKFAAFQDDNKLIEARKIFSNNLFVATLELIFGFTILIPLGLILINGLAIGITTELFSKIAGSNPNSFLLFVAALLPHGIVELPAVFLSAILGIVMILRRKREIFFNIIKIYIFIIIPLLALAALLEVFITPLIVQLTK